MRTNYSLIVLSLIFFSPILCTQPNQKNRVIILSDIEAEPDDTQSFVRLLLYSNVIDIEGLIATTSIWKRTSVAPGSIKKLIEAYGKVQPNLLKHDAGFPEAEALLSLVKQGLPEYGMQGVGVEKDSEGSDWIIKVLEEKDERPLWISVWGGANTLAQALDKIRKTKTEAAAKKLIAKLRVYTISDQDDSGIWIRNNFPDLFYIVSPGDHYGSATWSAINTFVKGINNDEISNSWIAQNIQQGHGPLGAIYPDVAWGMEGDTPSFLSLIPNGLNEPEHPEWGGWGGRYELYKPDFADLRKEVQVFPLNLRQGRSGPMQLIVIHLINLANIEERFVGTRSRSLITKHLYGVGGMTFKMILPPEWIGAWSHTKKLIMRQFLF